MEIQEKRIFGALFLLLGFTFITVGLYSEQLEYILRLMSEVFKPAVAGLP